MWLLLVAQLAMWERVQPPILHQGSWQSCKQEDGTYAERVLEHRVNRKLQWELHLGPKDEFALYDHAENGPDHSHDGRRNFLAPAYRVHDVATWRGKRTWSVAHLYLWVSIVRAGGSRDDCESFYVRIEDTRGRRE